MCIFEFFDHIKFCKVGLNISKVKWSTVYILHILIFIWNENVKKWKDAAEYTNWYGKLVSIYSCENLNFLQTYI